MSAAEEKPAPEMRKIRAADVMPYEWGVWCTVGDDPKPFANAIEGRKWSEDGQKIWFLLATHQFYDAEPDAEVELVPLPQGLPPEFMASRETNEAFMAKRPKPTRVCSCCGGSGKVPA